MTSLAKLEFDTKKMPLGKLSTKQLDNAQALLIKITKIIQKKTTTDTELTDLSSDYYTLIPYPCGRKKPPLIDSQEIVDKYKELIEELRNMVITVKLLENSNANLNNNPLDNIYNDLNTTIKPISNQSEIWKHIHDYMKNTHGKTHHFSTEILDIFEINRKNENDLSNTGNNVLLWHGSKLTNFCSILQKGLLLDPSNLGIKITGKMFGYGVYFANSSKSIPYCDTQSTDNIGCLLLCEVALGNCSKRTESDYYITKDELKKENCDSTWGRGRNTPRSYVQHDSYKIPNGKLKATNLNTSLLYDEFIVYDTNQFKIKYMVLFKTGVA